MYMNSVMNSQNVRQNDWSSPNFLFPYFLSTLNFKHKFCHYGILKHCSYELQWIFFFKFCVIFFKQYLFEKYIIIEKYYIECFQHEKKCCEIFKQKLFVRMSRMREHILDRRFQVAGTSRKAHWWFRNAKNRYPIWCYWSRQVLNSLQFHLQPDSYINFTRIEVWFYCCRRMSRKILSFIDLLIPNRKVANLNTNFHLI